MKKKVHVISHTHWDREWYLPYEAHHMRLVDLFNDLEDLFDNDPSFKSFHLDGQTIPIDDYLQVYPDKKEKIKKYVEDGKLKIGPFYILQDDFLISAESNARNTLIGMNDSKKWGDSVKLGYFPDTFGNMGQAPQLMSQAGLEAVAFGRGVKATGFNNVVIEDYASKYSELFWEGADKTKIFSLLFANWYSNGNEIPSTEKEARIYWDKALKDVESYASTKHLLMMNGVDHQPVQKDIGKAIALANELYPDYEFVHSDFDTYIKEVKADLPEEIGFVSGELKSQETDGWYTLANTASSRVYLKQMNTETSNHLEQVSEPLAVMASFVSESYPHEKFNYAWKTLLQNHPHDSICGCSVDEVHEGMVTRFKNALEVSKHISEYSQEVLVDAMDTSKFSEDARLFTIFNTQGQSKTQSVVAEVEWKRLPFSQDSRWPHEWYEDVEKYPIPNFKVVDSEGNNIPYVLKEVKAKFNYDLPRDKFRQPYFAQYVSIEVSVVNMDPYSWNTLALIPTDTKQDLSLISDKVWSNEYLEINLDDKHLNVLDKNTNTLYKNVLKFEDVGDIGNEYIFKGVREDTPIMCDTIDSYTVIENNDLKTVLELHHSLEIPLSADETLRYEQESVTEIRLRKAKRSHDLKTLNLKTYVILEKGNPSLIFETEFDNQMEDHRVRALFNLGIKDTSNYAESIYEVVKRDNGVSASWENPTNPQHQHSFVAMKNQDTAILIGNIGLNEYEILNNETVAITLLRSVGEMGDWGYFPTPEAQCIGVHKVSYSLSICNTQDINSMYAHVRSLQVPLVISKNTIHKGNLKAKHTFMDIKETNMILTSLKCKERSLDVMLRGYNVSDTTAKLEVSLNDLETYKSNVVEEYVGKYESKVKAHEIVTVGFKRDK